MNKKIQKGLFSILPSLLAVIIALIIGAIVIALKGVNPLTAYASMIKAAFYQTSTRYPFNGLAKTLVFATPLLFSALAVMLSFRAGMFNIGVQGQMMAGGLGATLVGIYCHNIFGNIVVALLVAALFGFIWAGIAGLLKSVFGINEVISTIMLNYTIAPIQNFLLGGPLKDPSSSNTQTVPIYEGVRLPTLFQEITKQSLNIGFIIAILTCVAAYYFFKNTTLGYKIKAVGNNPTVAENAGINPKTIAFIAMGIAGAIAGIGGAERILGGSTQYVYTDQIMGDFGFTGLAVSLLGKNNPFGIVVASIFYAALEIGGQTLQIDYKLDKEIVYIIQALIIILVAAENLFKYMLDKKRKGKN
ncbi:ABC transporter permease [Caviibacter abscessus]|uniref:ABC transporter permease n=1 Tax=Caviibacter abscessus TaxID=1766719 RepID=UPI0008309CA7|nr:ABC transporter permease [Caviibacter abscessus]